MAMRKLLFLGISHPAETPRLLHRQARALEKSVPDLSCVYVGRSSFDPAPGAHPPFLVRRAPRWSHGFRPGALGRWLMMLTLCIRTRPDWVQASDVRELGLGVLICALSGARLVYDSHEDYLHQARQNAGDNWAGRARGVWYRAKELALARFATRVFCTDDVLYGLYGRRAFGIRRLYRLRNFVPAVLVPRPARAPGPGQPLRLVYAGSSGAHRGLAQCAEFVRRYNLERGAEALTFDVYAKESNTIRELARRGRIRHHRRVAYPQLLERLSAYHVGVCLWQSTPKHRRNLPMKNFDYMAAGLPLLTSRFDQLLPYVEGVGSGICIDPSSYADFERAADRLREPVSWGRFARNGLEATRERFALAPEIAPYVDTFRV